MGVVVILTMEEEVTGWWPEEGEQLSYPLVVDGIWEEGEEVEKVYSFLR